MTAPDVRVERDPAAVAHAAAQAFWQTVDAALQRQQAFRVALAGGHTPALLYHELVRQRPAGPAWARLQFFFGDERCVPPDHADSNYRMVRAALFDHAPVVPGQVHRMPGEQRPLEAAAAAYEAELGGTPLDLVLLGVGNDGHTCSLFPGSAASAEQARWVLATLAPAGNAVRERLTLTFPCLDHAGNAWFIVTGTGKAHVVERVLGPAEEPPLPAARVRAGRVRWFLDRGAAGALALP